MPLEQHINENKESTESKIKDAAKIVFHKKGFTATRTRDIAEEAGLNLALLNYYFRSKKKLFEIIMMETLAGFMQNIALVFNDESLTLVQKIETIADKYIDLLIEEPELPIFILSEMRNDPQAYANKMPIAKMILQSDFAKQFQQAFLDNKVNEANPIHFIMNLLSLIVFPFAASPMMKLVGNLNNNEFEKIMLKRKKKIPVWIAAMFFNH